VWWKTLQQHVKTTKHSNRWARAFWKVPRQDLLQKPKDHRGLQVQVFETNRCGPQLRDCLLGAGRLSAAAVGQLIRAQTSVKQRLERVCFQHPTKAVGKVPILTEFADDALNFCFKSAVKRLAERRNDLVRLLLGLLGF